MREILKFRYDLKNQLKPLEYLFQLGIKFIPDIKKEHWKFEFSAIINIPRLTNDEKQISISHSEKREMYAIDFKGSFIGFHTKDDTIKIVQSILKYGSNCLSFGDALEIPKDEINELAEYMKDINDCLNLPY